MDTNVQTNRYACPACGGLTKLPEPIPQEGLFRISCALCHSKTLIRFSNGFYKIEQSPTDRSNLTSPSHSRNSNSDSSNQDSRTNFFNRFTNPERPFLEKKKVEIFNKEDKSRNNFKSLKERVSKNAAQAPFFGIFDKIQKFLTDIPYKIRSLWKNSPHDAIIQQRNYSNSSSTKRKQGSILRKFYFVGLSGLIICGILLAYLGAGILQTKSELNEILNGLSKGKPTKILDRNGQVVSEIFQKRISTLKISDYPENLVTALLNVEDRNFYSHGGIDYFAILRAMATNIIHLRYKQGASTITQQLARILLDDRTKSLGRKWKELELALALEAYLTKDQILEYYMNNVYLGHGAFGFGEAIKFYFNKNPSELNRAEAILLATLPSAPNRNSPLKNPQLSKTRLDYILITFKNRGILKDIPQDEVSSIYTVFSMRSPNETVYGNRQDLAPYVTEHVRSLLKQQGDGVDIYDQGGYTVETTLLKGIQEEVGKIVHNHLQKIQKNGQVRRTLLSKRTKSEPKEVLAIRNLLQETSLVMSITSASEWIENESSTAIGLQAGIIAVDPGTGEVLFMHGGDEFKSQNQFNRAIQMRRQTGSSIKPILYASAINSGKITNADKIMDAPLIFRGASGMPNWMPDNLGKSYEGEISLRTALVKSKNTAAVQIAEKLGYSQLDHYFSQFFFPDSAEKSKRFRNDLSLALGSLEISPLEMASAFTSFANEGKVLRPYLVKRILNPNGKVIYSYKNRDEFDLKVPEERSVIKPDSAEVILSLLKDSGRASGVYGSGYKGIVAGKTGTTNDYKDAWFVGLRPSITLAIWIGYDSPRYGMGSGGLGGTVAAPLWGEIMKAVDAGRHIKSEPFPKPVFAVSAKVCSTSKTSCSDCLGSDQEWFTQDNTPTQDCVQNNYSSDSKKEVLQDLF
ncbi:transglycosylase domain-containing protein [Leptospira sp. GIMC2001]|uniref:transglycosylase domain-containing protein n=1 Tax=Leptospira sp. GIMC2001 TaxID=1513297 RepID=UPI002348F80D|nr:transglycosylase domain-containing protein [Leptospira sp. GIMC2001]WCL49864.1 transglycosylase domain-containing protein [Leptospira sp. GIMC2001]